MWMLMLMLHSPLSPDAMKPEMTYYQTQTECQVFLEAAQNKGTYNAFCVKVTWQ